MKLPSGLVQQSRGSISILLYVCVPTAAVVAGVKAYEIITGDPPSFLLDDPYYLADMSPFFGLVSNLGVLIWCTSAAILLFSWWVGGRTGVPSEWRKFLLASGLLTVLLLIDDLFAVHESVPELLFGDDRTQTVQDTAELAIFVSYGLILLAFIARFRHRLAETRLLIGCFSICCFAVSLVFDVAHVRPTWEEGFKLLGIVTYATYFIVLSRDVVAEGQPTNASTRRHAEREDTAGDRPRPTLQP